MGKCRICARVNAQLEHSFFLIWILQHAWRDKKICFIYPQIPYFHCNLKKNVLLLQENIMVYELYTVFTNKNSLKTANCSIVAAAVMHICRDEAALLVFPLFFHMTFGQ